MDQVLQKDNHWGITSFHKMGALPVAQSTVLRALKGTDERNMLNL